MPIFLAALTLQIITRIFLVPLKVKGASMVPTYQDGSVAFLNLRAYKNKMPERGDVVVIQDQDDLIMKRLIAVPGDVVTLEHDKFVINGEVLQDQYSEALVRWQMSPVTLSNDQYFYAGDNRSATTFGTCRRGDILGKVK